MTFAQKRIHGNAAKLLTDTPVVAVASTTQYTVIITAKFDGTVEHVYGPFNTQGAAEDYLYAMHRNEGRELGLEYTIAAIVSPPREPDWR